MIIGDLLGTTTDRSVDGIDWDKNLDEIKYPGTGMTPFMSPGETLFKPGEKPKVVKENKEDPMKNRD